MSSIFLKDYNNNVGHKEWNLFVDYIDLSISTCINSIEFHSKLNDVGLLQERMSQLQYHLKESFQTVLIFINWRALCTDPLYSIYPLPKLNNASLIMTFLQVTTLVNTNKW